MDNMQLIHELQQISKMTSVSHYKRDVCAVAATELSALQAELEKVRRERDAARSLLAERICVIGAGPITTAFGLPIDRLRELAEADREGKIPKYTIGDTIYDRFGDAW